jgi:hypothetical protein
MKKAFLLLAYLEATKSRYHVGIFGGELKDGSARERRTA